MSHTRHLYGLSPPVALMPPATALDMERESTDCRPHKSIGYTVRFDDNGFGFSGVFV